MSRPSENVTIFSEDPSIKNELPTGVKSDGYQNNQVITAGEYNKVMSDYQKWIKYITDEQVPTLQSLITALGTRATELETKTTSLETSRTNRVGEIVTTLSNTRPADCLKCDGSLYTKSNYPELITYALNNNLFPLNVSASQRIHGLGFWGKLIHSNHDPNHTKFHVPNLQGMFLRMPGGNAGALGEYQGDSGKSLSIRYTQTNQDWNSQSTFTVYQDNNSVTFPAFVKTGHGNIHSNPHYKFGTEETRPKNVAVNFWIRYQ